MAKFRRIAVATMFCGCLFLSGCFNESAKLEPLTADEMVLQEKTLQKGYLHPSRWEKTMARIKANDLENPPPQNAVLFVGSSSILAWKTLEWFPDIVTINRGFGGSQIVDSWYHADTVVLAYKPKTIVFYAGDNDVSGKKSPEMILVNFKAFAIRVREALPETKIIFIAIKPSILRWKLWPQIQEANKLIKNYCNDHKGMHFVDVSKVMLDSSGKPIKEYFQADGLHMTLQGYEQWHALIRPLIR